MNTTEKVVKSMRGKSDAATRAGSSGFLLQEFFPYQVRVFYRAVSESIEHIYKSLFGLSVSEWRTMTVLGPDGRMSGSEIVEASSMHKVNVTRAVKKLKQSGYLRQDVNGEDRRMHVLGLTREGREVYRSLIPQVLEAEQLLLNGVTREERETLTRIMAKIRANAEKISCAGLPGSSSAESST